MNLNSFHLFESHVARSVLVLALSSAAVAACSNGPGQGMNSTAPEGAAGDSSSAAGARSYEPDAGDAGAGGGGGETEVVEPSDCEPTSKQDEPDGDNVDANCDGIDGDVTGGVFVSTTGFDDAAGTIKKPVQSLAKAVELAADGDRPVYVCNGTYRENLVIEAPVSIFGGYDCTRGWRRTKDWAVLQAGAGVPLAIQNVDGKVHLERLSFRAPGGLGAGQSSQAAAVVGSSDVTLAQVELKTGRGAAGMSGASGNNAAQTSPRTSDQGDPGATVECWTPDAGGLPDYPCDWYAAGGFAATTTLACGSVVMRGGAGGAGGNVWLAKGKPACFQRGSDTGEAGLAGQFHTGDGKWQDFALADLGMNGADGTDGAGATLGIGSVVEGVYAATNAGVHGLTGQPGFPGRGGTGGASSGHAGDVCGSDYRTGSGGGQGGLGGCPGGRGTAGGAGGGAVGLVIINSGVKIAFARFVIGDGGDGGSGAGGGIGQSGGEGGLGGDAYTGTYYRGAAGQPGGRGGAGGDGGPGGGGPSVAVLVTGAMPEVSDAVYELGAPGVGGEAFSGPNGANGVTGEVVSLDEILGNKP